MSTNNTKATTTFPDDEPNPRSIFNDIIEAAQGHWIPLDPMPIAYRRMGHMTAWGERSLRVDLSYNPNGNRIRLQVVLADQVQENSEIFQDLLWRANAAYPGAKIIFDRNLRVIIAQSNSDCLTLKEDISGIVNSVYNSFNSLINDECLRSALDIGKSRMLGTPLNLWNHE